MRGVIALERQTLASPPLVGTVLRYGWLYGPGTGTDVPAGSPGVHVDAESWSPLLAAQSPHHGIFNIGPEDCGFLSEVELALLFRAVAQVASPAAPLPLNVGRNR